MPHLQGGGGDSGDGVGVHRSHAWFNRIQARGNFDSFSWREKRRLTQVMESLLYHTQSDALPIYFLFIPLNTEVLLYWCNRIMLLRCYCYSAAKSCLTLCGPMDCSTPGFPVLHCLPKFAQTPVHWDGDAIQPSHPLLPLSPPAFNLSQHLFQMSWLFESGGQSIGASVFPMNIQDWDTNEFFFL